MKKDEILNASRKEHRNKDLAEMEVVYQAGSHASKMCIRDRRILGDLGHDVGIAGQRVHDILDRGDVVSAGCCADRCV